MDFGFFNKFLFQPFFEFSIFNNNTVQMHTAYLLVQNICIIYRINNAGYIHYLPSLLIGILTLNCSLQELVAQVDNNIMNKGNVDSTINNVLTKRIFFPFVHRSNIVPNFDSIGIIFNNTLAVSCRESKTI